MKKVIIDFPNVHVEHFIGTYGEVYNLYINGVLDASYAKSEDIILRLHMLVSNQILQGES